MLILVIVICVLVVALIGLALSLRIVKQYEQGVLFRLGRVVGGPRGRAWRSSSRSSTSCTG